MTEGVRVLLRRITEHVKAQNWLAIGIDFLIVVVGVFIGIQVSNWNDARSDRVEAGAALERLTQDFERNLGRTERSLSAHQENLAAATRLIEGIRSTEFDLSSINADTKFAVSFTTPPGPSTTFRELVSGGRLGLISSDALRQALYEYDDYVTFVRDQYGYFVLPLGDSRRTLMRARSLAVTGEPTLEIADTWSTATVDTSILIDDPEMLTALQTAYGTQDNIHAVLAANEQRIRSILELIKTEQRQ